MTVATQWVDSAIAMGYHLQTFLQLYNNLERLDTVYQESSERHQTHYLYFLEY